MSERSPLPKLVQPLLSVLLGATLGAAITWLLGARGDLSEQLTYERLLSVSIGASAGEVVGQLGYPLSIKANGGRRAAPLGRTDPWPEAYVWVYASPNRWIVHEGLAVTISLQEGRVSAVYAKYDDLPLYWRPAPDGDRPEKLARLREALAK